MPLSNQRQEWVLSTARLSAAWAESVTGVCSPVPHGWGGANRPPPVPQQPAQLQPRALRRSQLRAILKSPHVLRPQALAQAAGGEGGGGEGGGGEGGGEGCAHILI